MYYTRCYKIFVCLWYTILLLYLPGGRFKKEVVIEGQSYLLLIRDEGGPPEIQVSLNNRL